MSWEVLEYYAALFLDQARTADAQQSQLLPPQPEQLQQQQQQQPSHLIYSSESLAHPVSSSDRSRHDRLWAAGLPVPVQGRLPLSAVEELLNRPADLSAPNECALQTPDTWLCAGTATASAFSLGGGAVDSYSRAGFWLRPLASVAHMPILVYSEVRSAVFIVCN